MPLPMETDVIVIGAGIAGLVAARDLVAAGHTVIVLEARDRVGGRTLSAQQAGQTIDLGGQWMGDQHVRLRTLASELGIESFAQLAKGKKVLLRGDSRKTFSGFLPKIGILPLLDLGIAITRLERLAKRVVLDDPMTTREAATLDAQTAADWIARRVRSRGAREMLGIATQMIFAAEPKDLSLLFLLLYAKSGGGFQRLAEIEGGAQERRFVTGAQSISERLAARITAKLLLEHPVRSIEQDASGVTVHSAKGTFRAARVIVAVPPALACKIEGLPVERAKLHARMPMGSVIKCIASYDRPFWREAGYSGEAISTTGIVRATFDDCSRDGDHAALVAFIVGDAAKQLRDSPDRQQRVIAELVTLHGPAAGSPIAYVDRDWQAEEWSAGCYVGVMPPGVLSEAGNQLRAVCGRLHFAGTETAVHHVGYIEGAIESGERVAREIRDAILHVVPGMTPR